MRSMRSVIIAPAMGGTENSLHMEAALAILSAPEMSKRSSDAGTPEMFIIIGYRDYLPLLTFSGLQDNITACGL